MPLRRARENLKRVSKKVGAKDRITKQDIKSVQQRRRAVRALGGRVRKNTR